MALRMSRTMIDPKTATTTAAMKPCTWLNPIAVASQPPIRPPTIPMTMLGRQPRPVPPPTRAPEIAPAKKPTTIHPMKFISSMWRVLHDGGRPRAQRRAAAPSGQELLDCRDHPVGMRVVGRVTGSIDDDDAAVSQPLVERERSVAEDGHALAAEELEDRLADGAQPVERGGRVRFGLELAQDRAGRG